MDSTIKAVQELSQEEMRKLAQALTPQTIERLMQGFSDAQLHVVGAALHREPLERVWRFYEGVNAARDTKERGELFNDRGVDGTFTEFIEELGNVRDARAHGLEGILPEAHRLLTAARAQQMQAAITTRQQPHRQHE